MYSLYALGFAAALAMSVLFTPVVKRFAHWVGAVDAPNHRKVHTRIMPRLGGLAIFLSFVGAFFIVQPALQQYNSQIAWGLLLGGAIIVLVGALDDRFQLSPKLKLLGQLAAAGTVVGFGLKIDLVNLPFGDYIPIIGWLSIPLTIFWIIGVTNAINLIDGLDGLAAGVSGIATATTLALALLVGGPNAGTVALLCTVLLGSIIGFLFFNFHPAKIFMGDSGALFLGFSLATLSVLGFKQATLVSFVVPLLILGVPLSDTFFAIVRRKLNHMPISVADKNHLHHCLLQLGFSHRNTVLIIYGISIFFGVSAVVLSQISDKATWIALVLMAILLLVMQVGAEMIGIVNKKRKPVIHLVRRLSGKSTDLARERSK